MTAAETDPIVHLVDDDASFRGSMAFLLEVAGFKTRSYDSAEAFLAQELPTHGCLVLDLAMPGLSGIELQDALVAHGCTMPILFLTAHGELRTGVRAMKAGAQDFLSKPVDAPELIEAVRQALARSASQHAEAKHRSELEARIATLTPRERQVLDLVVAGRRNKQIAADLGLALQTVKFHRSHIMEKLGATNAADLARRVEGLRPRPGRNASA